MITKMTLGIDLGTANILIHTNEKGMIINEPAIVAYHTDTQEVVAVGSPAKEMIGKTPKNIVTIQPIQSGVIADFDMASQLLKHLLKIASKMLGMSIRKPTVIASVPSHSTAVEQRAIHNAIASFGVRKIHLIKEPVASAIGAELPVNEPVSSAIVDIGGGTSEISIISYGGIVSSHAIRVAGNKLDEDIKQYIREKYHMVIGDRTAEQIKCTIGYAPIDHEHETMIIRGRERVTGLPKNLTITSTEIQQAITHSLEQILEAIRATLEQCPPELSGDLVNYGLTLTGGGALMKGMQEWLQHALDIPIHMAPSPLESVALGTGKAFSVLPKQLHATK